jgi:hypothetical protein
MLSIAGRTCSSTAMAKKFPIHPQHPERVCWGCDHYCRAASLACGNGTERTPHPAEVFGEDWAEWGLDAAAAPRPANPALMAPR